MDLGECAKSELALLEAIKVDAMAFNALFALSETYLRQNKLAEAEKVLVQGLGDSGPLAFRSSQISPTLLEKSA